MPASPHRVSACPRVRQVRKAYKQLAVQLHPDKLRVAASCPPSDTADDAAAAAAAAAADRADALRSQFQEVVEAHDVLCDEERRASYDRLRQQLLTGGGGGGGAGGGAGGSGNGRAPLTAEEAAAMMAGMRELAKMRRAGLRRSAKHAATVAEVWVSLPKLNRGCTKSVPVRRTTLDPSGGQFTETKARSS